MKFWKTWDKYGIYMISIMIVSIFGIVTPNMFTAENIVNFLVTASMTGIVAAGMTLVIVTGGIDLSVGSLLALSSCVAGVCVLKLELHFMLAILVAIAFTVFFGILNGLIIVKLNVQPFVATLAMQVIVRGIAYLMTDGKFVFFLSKPEMKVVTSTRVLGLPLPVLILFAVFIVVAFLYQSTSYGVKIRSIGSNFMAAKLSGINYQTILILTFALSAFFAAIGGIITAAQTMTGTPNYGSTLPADCITAVVLGGTSLKGGRGRLFGTMIATILVVIINNGLNLLSVTVHYQHIITALILLFVLFMDGMKAKALSAAKQNYHYYE